MFSLLVLVVVVLILFIGIAVGVFVWLKANASPPGFDDWVKNPAYKQAAADYLAAVDSMEVPKDISEKKIQRMVDSLFDEDVDHATIHRLKLVGPRALPALVAALERREQVVAPFSGSELDDYSAEPQTPLENIIEVLSPLGPPQAALPLAAFMEHDHKLIRQQVAMALGNIGTADCIPPMLKALDDDDDYVRSFAMLGIERGMEAGRCSEEFLRAMFPALVPLAKRSDESCCDSAPQLLLDIDADRAKSNLFSAEYFSPDNPIVMGIMRAMNAAGQAIPHEILKPFLVATKPKDADDFNGYRYAEALISYAHHPDSEAEATFRKELTSPHPKVAPAAATAMAIISGVTQAESTVFQKLESKGFNGLSQRQQFYFGVFTYDAEVNNGGHAQFFVNSSGDLWSMALRGLAEIGADEREQILRSAIEAFGKDGPALDSRARHKQLARFNKQQMQRLSDLDQQCYECKQSVAMLLTLYTIEHKSDFA